MLIGTDFSKANLGSATFYHADAEGAIFVEAYLEPATDSNFVGANLERTDFTLALLRNSNFSLAILSGAKFQGAHLQGANFTNAELRGATFAGAHLEGANLAMASGLQRSQLANAITDAKTQLPEDWD